MINGKSVIAIIPARAGSKGLPGKNIKALCGKPLIAWSIEAGLKSKYIDELVVSTDSNEIADIARKYGANVPFIRPEYLASDTASSFTVIKHCLDYYSNLNKVFNYVALLEPTSPLREVSDIDDALSQLDNSKYRSIVSVARTESQNPAFLLRLERDNKITGYLDYEIKIKRRQEIEDIYYLEGTIYAAETEYLLNKESFYGDQTMGYIVPKYKALEIDDIYDFIMVEAIMKYKGY